MKPLRRDGRAVDGGGLENRCTRKGIGGSNPSPSAKLAPLVYITNRKSQMDIGGFRL